jgi:predicted ferric reductase
MAATERSREPAAFGRTVDRLSLRAVYAMVAFAPFALIAGAMKPGAQGVLVVFSDGLGFAALSLLALQVVISGRWSGTTRSFGLRGVLTLHRQAGMAVLVLALMHVVILLLDDPSRLALLDSLTAPGRARAGMLALLALVALAVTSAFRQRLRMTYERWRALHLAATALALGGAFVHVVWVDAYTSLPAVRLTVLGLVLAAACALFWTRVLHPYATALRPYRVLSVRQERGDAVTLELAADGHIGLRFGPGQFARLRSGDCVYGMDEHPFTLSSAAQRPDRPAFTIKALGDFSRAVAGLEPGMRVLVDGPHGEAAYPARGVRGRLLLAAGIGITPALSVIRTAAERGDQRPLLLLYGSRRWPDVTFREELEALQRRLPNLRVVHVLSRPDAGWTGERGRVGAELLRRHAPPDVARWSALICGPPAMVADTALALRGLGMPPTAIQAEGFA